MNEILLDVLSALVTFVLIPLLSWGGVELVRWLSTKTKNEKVQKYIEEATNAVVAAVSDVSQTYVDTLKKEGKFDKDAQVMAFELAKEKALILISANSKKAINTVYNDFDYWLKLMIEQKVKEQK